MHVPLLDLRAQLDGLESEIKQAVNDVIDSTRYIGGPKVEELERAIVLNLEKTHNLTEHAGASSLAVALKIKDRLRGKKVALVMSGGNISVPQLRTALSRAS